VFAQELSSISEKKKKRLSLVKPGRKDDVDQSACPFLKVLHKRVFNQEKESHDLQAAKNRVVA